MALDPRLLEYVQKRRAENGLQWYEDQEPEAAPAEPEGPTAGERLAGAGLAGLQGAMRSVKVVPDLVQMAMPNPVTGAISDRFQEAIDIAQDWKPDSIKKELSNQIFSRDENGDLDFNAPNAAQLADVAGGFLPQIPSMMVGGGILTRLSMVQKAGAGLANAMKLASPAAARGISSAIGLGSTNALMVTPESYDSTRREGLAAGMTEEEARNAGLTTAGIVAPMSFLTGAAGLGAASYLGRGSGILGGFAKGAAADAPFEFVEEGGQSLATDYGLGRDPNYERAGSNAVLGLAAGGLAGGAFGAASGRQDALDTALQRAATARADADALDAAAAAAAPPAFLPGMEPSEQAPLPEIPTEPPATISELADDAQRIAEGNNFQLNEGGLLTQAARVPQAPDASIADLLDSAKSANEPKTEFLPGFEPPAADASITLPERAPKKKGELTAMANQAAQIAAANDLKLTPDGKLDSDALDDAPKTPAPAQTIDDLSTATLAANPPQSMRRRDGTLVVDGNVSSLVRDYGARFDETLGVTIVPAKAAKEAAASLSGKFDEMGPIPPLRTNAAGNLEVIPESERRTDGKVDVLEKGATLVHGSPSADLSSDGIEIVRQGQKQGKKGRSYGGFYTTSEQDLDQAQNYANMGGGTPTLYDVRIKPGTKVLNKTGDITRLSADYIAELTSQGIGVVVGKSPTGKTEYVVIDKGAVESMSKRGNRAPNIADAPNTDAPNTASESWQRFKMGESLNVPRAEMPQIKAGDRSSLVQFARARGVESAQETVDPGSLKPTQQEFSPAKVAKAREFVGEDRAILVSSDNRIIDGHHQWLAKKEAGAPIRVIRLQQTAKELLPLVREFPSATFDQASAPRIDAGTKTQAAGSAGETTSENGVAQSNAPASAGEESASAVSAPAQPAEAKGALPDAVAAGAAPAGKVSPRDRVAAVLVAAAKERGDKPPARVRVTETPVKLRGAEVVIGETFGRKVVFFSTDDVNAPNGFVDPSDPKTLYINTGSEKPVMRVLMHELLHSLRTSHARAYSDLVAATKDMIRGDAKSKWRDVFLGKDRDGDLPDADVIEEILADSMGDYGVTQEFWSKLSERMEPSLFQRVLKTFGEIIEKMMAALGSKSDMGSKQYLSDLRGVQRALLEFADAGRTEPTTAKPAAKAEPRGEPVTQSRKERTGKDTKLTGDKVIDAYLALTDSDKAFQLPTSRALDLETVVSEVITTGPDETPAKVIVEEPAPHKKDVMAQWEIRRVPIVVEQGYGYERPSRTRVYQTWNNEIYIDISDNEEGTGGRSVYSAVANYAYNNGLVFKEDPSGLTPASMYRRTENMLSSALKFGTTKHLAPGPFMLRKLRRGDGSNTSLTWGNDDTKNFRKLLELSVENMRAAVPAIRDMSYNATSGQFENADGTHATDGQFDALARTGPARNAKAGRTTLQRAVVGASLLRGLDPGRLDALLRVAGQDGGLRAPRGIAYARKRVAGAESPSVTALDLPGEDRGATSLDLLYPRGKAPKVEGGLTGVVNFLEDRSRASLGRSLDIYDEADQKRVSRMIAAETLAAIKQSGNASEWYDTTINRMMGLASAKFPELSDDADARSAFTMAMAISSQKQDVESNLKYAERQYRYFRENGRFEEIGTGEAADAMRGNFALANALLDRFGGAELRRFLATPLKVSELGAMGFDVGGEYADTEVLGSSVFGPKIGYGFLSNLNGNFEPVTMDMWFMRTIGRLTGKLRLFDEKLFGAQLGRLRAALKVKGDPDAGLFADGLGLDVKALAEASEDELVEVAFKVKRAHEKDFKVNRAAFDAKTRSKTPLVSAAENIIKSATKPKDAPSQKERPVLRKITQDASDIVSETLGRRVQNAALQALIWYPEQFLYKDLGVKLRVVGQDYRGALRQLLAKEGFTDEQLDAAESGSGSARRGDGLEVEGRPEGDGGQGLRPVPFQGRERADFLKREAVRNVRDILRRGVGVAEEGAPEPYSRNSGRDGTRVRGLKLPTVATFTLDKKLKNRLSTAGVEADKVHELEPSEQSAQAFADTITESKGDTKFGAAVYAYSPEEYAQMRLFVADGGRSGFALKGDDIVSVFSRDGGARANSMLLLAVQEGGRRLDAFNTVLPRIYGRNGFKIVARQKWNDDYSPAGWDKETFAEFNDGEPDVVFMVYDREYQKIPGPEDGKYADSYDDAVELQAAARQDSAKPKFSRKERAPVTVEKEGIMYVARAGKKVVGRAHPWEDSQGNWVMENIRVSPDFRGRGVGRAIYSEVEKQSGRELKPAISLSDDAFEFWKRYRPDAVKDDLRHRADLVGTSVVVKGRAGTIKTASGKVAIVKYDDENSTVAVRGDKIDEAIAAAKGDVKLSRAAVGPREQPLFAGTPPMELGAENLREKLTRTFVNNLNRVDKARDYLASKGATLTDENDVATAETLYYGKTGEMLRQLDQKHIKPLMELVKRAENMGLGVKEVDDYLIALHAEERNAQVAKINPGVTDGSGMTDAEAQRIKSSYGGPRKAALDAVSAAVQAMHRERIDVLRTFGLAEPSTLQSWTSAYQNYVPLKTVDEEPDALGTGMGYDIRGSESKRALGRGSRATSPLMVSILDAQRTIIRAQKAEVGRSILKLAEEDVGKDLFEIKTQDQFRTEVYNSATGKVQEALDTGAMREAFAVKVGGQVQFVVVKDELLRMQIQKIGGNDVGPLLRVIGKVTRTLSKLYTQYNPSFTLVNAVRDAITAGVNAQAYDRISSAKLLRQLPKAWKAIAAVNFGKGTADWKKTYEEFLEDGASSGGFGLDTIKDISERAERDFKLAVGQNGLSRSKQAWHAAVRGMGHIGTAVSNANEVFENAARLSLYAQARDNGYTRQQAARMAKEITVNFNRKGEWGSQINSAFMFFNAAVQGNRALYTHMQKSPKVKAAVFGIGAVGFILAMLNDGMDDDEETLDEVENKTADWEQDHSAVLFTDSSGARVKFPLPYGYNVAYVLGRRAYRLMTGKDGAQKTAIGMVAAAYDSFMPLGGSANDATMAQAAVRTLLPTIGTPFFDLSVNRDQFGKPIAKEIMNRYDANVPNSQRYFRGVSPWAKALTETLNDVTGGSKVKAGAIDINPEHLDFWLKFATGGAGSTVTGFAQLAGDDPSINRAPFVKAFYGAEPDYYVSSRFNEVRQTTDVLEGRMRDGDDTLSDDELRVARTSRAVGLALNRLFKRRKAAEAAGGDLTVLEDQIERQQKRLIRAYNEEGMEAGA